MVFFLKFLTLAVAVAAATATCPAPPTDQMKVTNPATEKLCDYDNDPATKCPMPHYIVPQTATCPGVCNSDRMCHEGEVYCPDMTSTPGCEAPGCLTQKDCDARHAAPTAGTTPHCPPPPKEEMKVTNPATEKLCNYDIDASTKCTMPAYTAPQSATCPGVCNADRLCHSEGEVYCPDMTTTPGCEIPACLTQAACDLAHAPHTA